MIKQALNAPTIANVMSRFAKDDAIKLLGKSTYNKWLKKLPANRIASNARGQVGELWEDVDLIEYGLRAREADRLQRSQDMSNALMYRYGPGFAANLPRVNERLDTRSRLKGYILNEMPRVNYLKNFTNRNNLVSRDELLRWSRTHKAGLDPKTLTSEWYTVPTVNWDETNVFDILRDPRHRPDKIAYNGKKLPIDEAYLKAHTVRNIAAVPYTDPIRHTAERLVANELHKTLRSNAWRKSIYNSVSDNTRKALDNLNGRNVLEDPRAARLVDAANKHGRLAINIDPEFKNGTNAAFFPLHNILATHPNLTQDVKNHEWVHYLLHNMGTQEHADIASRTFRNIAAISRKNPKYSNLSSLILELPNEAHEAVTDYLRHKLFGTLGSRVDDYKAMGTVDTDLRFSAPEVNRVISEIQSLTSNPSLQQALQQLTINYGVPLRNVEHTLDSVPELVVGDDLFRTMRPK